MILSSCTKDDLVIIDGEPTVAGLSGATDENTVYKSGQYTSKGYTAPVLTYFLNGNNVENFVYNIYNPQLWVMLVVKEEKMNGIETLVYEFQAFDFEEDFLEWTETENIYAKIAFDIVGNISRLDPSGLDPFAQSLEDNITHYEDYMANLYDNLVNNNITEEDSFIPKVKNVTAFKGFTISKDKKELPRYGIPALYNDWNSAVSMVKGKNEYFPTILFSDILLQNRLNVMIWNRTDHPVPFMGILSGLNNQANSMF